jgi:hypothetical protein
MDMIGSDVGLDLEGVQRALDYSVVLTWAAVGF